MTPHRQRPELDCGSPSGPTWPPPRVPEGPRPQVDAALPDQTLDLPPYGLPGPQVEPEAACWLRCCPLPCISLEEVTGACSPAPFPTQTSVVRDELDELLELAGLRDDPEAVGSTALRRERRGISPFLQLRPQPFGAVVNVDRDPVLGPMRAGRLPEPGALSIVRGREVDSAYPVVRTGRELARYFEREPPGLPHRLALDYLLGDLSWSPPRQALAHAALELAIYTALAAAWHFKWAAGPGISFRPRPIEADHRISVLYNRRVNDVGSGDDARLVLPSPSPGTPRHPAYPSGHSTYSAAASEVLSFFFPDYSEEFDRLADNAGMARLWAGIHYRSDHTAGAALGRCVGRLVIQRMEAACVTRDDPCPPPDPCAAPPSPKKVAECCRRMEECCRPKPETGRAEA